MKKEKDVFILLMNWIGLRNNRKYDWVAISLAIILLVIVVFDMGIIFFRNKKEAEGVGKNYIKLELIENNQQEQKKEFDVKWKIYQDKKRGFKLKYPENWIKVEIGGDSLDFEWEQKVVFRENDPNKTKKENGFDLFIYNTNKTKKDFEDPRGKFSKEILLENKNCFKSDSFLKTKNEEYVYEIIPVFSEGSFFSYNQDIPIICSSNELIASVFSFEITNILRPKPRPVITAPMPVSYKKVNGKLVCAKKNDKPRKSKKNKGHHLDMECCLDPDEDPNPWCTYF